MKKGTSKKNVSKQIAFTAVFAALCFVGTYVTTVPMAVGNVNFGDVFVLLAGWFLGPLYGAVAAGVGSCLADVISGYVIYAPATFIIKAFDAFVSYLVWTFLKKVIKNEKLDFLPRVLAALVGEVWMIAGYFLFEGVFMVGFAGALANIPFNSIQGSVCLVGATLLTAALYPVKQIKSYFPLLSDPSKNPLARKQGA